MKVQFGHSAIELIRGSITAQSVDALVNSASATLGPGGEVDRAIQRAAGPAVREELQRRYPLGCPVGDAVVTAAGLMAARFVFHAVGPTWSGGRNREPELLRSVHRRCLELAVQHACHSIAFPAIGTGIFSIPVDVAAEQALGETRKFLTEHPGSLDVRFVLIDAGTCAAFARVLDSFAV